jgi:acetyl-CoA carboxylase biotin carboxylase subunit
MQMHHLDMVFSENSSSKICQEHGIKFIGASPEMIEWVIRLRLNQPMIEAGVPCVPGS